MNTSNQPHPISDQDREITETVLREQKRLGNFILSRVSNPTDADDILQDVFYEFTEACRLPGPIEQVSAWLFRVARNRIIDRFRKKKEELLDDANGNSDEHKDDDSSYRLDLMLPATDAGPEALYARSVLLQELEQAINELPEAQRDVFVAHELDGLSFKEIAMQNGVAINTLLARKRYAVSYLRTRLQKLYDDLDL